MIDGPIGVRQQEQRFTKRRFVEAAAHPTRAGISRYRCRNLEQERAALTREGAVHMAPRESLENAKRDGTSHQRRQRARRATPRPVYSVDQCPRPAAAGLAEGEIGIGAAPNEPRQREHFVKADPLASTNGVAIASNLQEDGFAQSEAFVAQLMHKVGIELSRRRVDGFDCLEEGERQPRVDRATGKRERGFKRRSGAGEPAVSGEGHNEAKLTCSRSRLQAERGAFARR